MATDVATLCGLQCIDKRVDVVSGSSMMQPFEMLFAIVIGFSAMFQL